MRSLGNLFSTPHFQVVPHADDLFDPNLWFVQDRLAVMSCGKKDAGNRGQCNRFGDVVSPIGVSLSFQMLREELKHMLSRVIGLEHWSPVASPLHHNQLGRNACID